MIADKKPKDLTRLWIELEWRRCAADESYFINNYVWVPSENDPRGRTKFHLFDYQEELLKTFKGNRFVVALKARQIGFTTLGMAHALWLALFRPGATILIVSQTQKSSNKNLGQARLAYRFLPEWMRSRGPALDNDSSQGMSFQFFDGMVSQLKAAPATNGVFAGETASFVLWDEAALVEPANLQEDVLRTLLPTTDAGGSMLIVSTARGSYNRFSKTYRTAKRGDSRFVAFFKPWMVSPFMQCSQDCGWCSGAPNQRTACQSKYMSMRREFADEPWRFYQEYPRDDEEAFRESGRPRFVGLPSEDTFPEFPFRGNLVWKDDNTIMFEHDEAGPLRLTTLDPDPDGFYVVGSDPSQGVGRDYATAHVMTLNESNVPEIVAYYHSNTTQPPEFAADLNKLGRFFAGRQWAALLAVEDQGGHGSLPINELHKHLEYPNPYVHQTPGQRRTKMGRFFAFPMTMDRRRAVVDRLAKYLVTTNGVVGMNNIYPLLRAELGQFVAQETAHGNIKYAADVGCHDDLVMSLAIATWILVEEFSLASPETASTEDAIWGGTPLTLNLSHIRQARDEALAEEESNRIAQWEAISLSQDLVIRPRGSS